MVGGIILLCIAFIMILFYNQVNRAKMKMDGSGLIVDNLLNERFDCLNELAQIVNEQGGDGKAMMAKAEELWKTCRVKPNKNRYHESMNEAQASLTAAIDTMAIKDSEAVRQLYDKLRDIDARLQKAKQNYNKFVKLYNEQIVAFPTSVFAKAMNAKERKPFDQA